MESAVKDEYKVAENAKCEFWKNSWTEGAEKWAREWGLKGIRCLLAIQKADQDRDYILIRDGEVVYANKQYEALAAHIDIMALAEGLKRKDSW